MSYRAPGGRPEPDALPIPSTLQRCRPLDPTGRFGRAGHRSELFFRDAAKADEYRVLQERLTAQLGRLRNRPATEVPPAMAAILRGIGLPR